MKNWVMLTLIPQSGKDNEAKNMLNKIIKKGGLKGVIIVVGGKRDTHYHLLGKDNSLKEDILSEWPGAIKKNTMTEYQAMYTKNKHEPYVIK